jgi:hypothetical protein
MDSEQDWPWFPLSRRTFAKTLSLACLACSPVMKACNLLSGENQFKEKKMETSAAVGYSGLPQPSRPLIDLAAPGRTETATFALG